MMRVGCLPRLGEAAVRRDDAFQSGTISFVGLVKAVCNTRRVDNFPIAAPLRHRCGKPYWGTCRVMRYHTNSGLHSGAPSGMIHPQGVKPG
jgi:hypothetical protein